MLGFCKALPEAREEMAVAVARFIEEVEGGCGGEEGEEGEASRGNGWGHDWVIDFEKFRELGWNGVGHLQ